MDTDKKPSLESTLKSADTEEFIDIHFYRPIGYKWALFFQKRGITPNVVTILSIFLGVGAGFCFYFDNIWITLLGIFLLVWANSYDSADGQLARMTGNYSPLGRILDGFAGDLWFASIYIAIALRLFPVWGAWIWILAIVAGYFHAKQASTADYYRNIHLLFLKGKSGSELSHSKALDEKNKTLTWKQNFFEKLVLFFYTLYTKDQESWTPNFQKLGLTLQTHFPNNHLPKTLCDDFRQKSLPLMKWTNILSFNTRAIVLFASMLIAQPWIYFVFELAVLNLLLINMIRKHEAISEEFTQKINNNKYESPMFDLSQVKGIIFDYGGTIDSNGKHWAEVLWESYCDQGVPVSKEAFREAYVYTERYLATHPVVEAKHNFHDLLTIKTELQFNYLFSHKYLEQNTKTKEYSLAISNQCYNFVRDRISAEKPILIHLHENYPMVLVSNFYGNIHAVLADFDLLDCFDDIIESAVVGLRKPDPAIFSLGVEKLALPAQRVVVVGDSYSKDIVPARTIGCQTVWLKGIGWGDEDENAEADSIIADFMELETVFKI